MEKTFWYYKENDLIRKADSLLKAKIYEDAKVAYSDAISKHPEHFYLKDALAHINYVKNTDASIISKQYETIAGQYGERKFWIENGKLYYKLGIGFRKELLPISENRYIDLSGYWLNYEFELKEDNTIASFAWEYDHENMEWVKLDDEVNYILKDK